MLIFASENINFEYQNIIIEITGITKEEAMQRFMLAKKRKADMLAKIEPELREKYEKATGLKANYFFAM